MNNTTEKMNQLITHQGQNPAELLEQLTTAFAVYQASDSFTQMPEAERTDAAMKIKCWIDIGVLLL